LQWLDLNLVFLQISKNQTLALTLSRDGWRSRAKYHPRALQEVAALFLSPFRVQMKQARGRCLVVVFWQARAYSATWHPRLSSADHIGPVHVNAMTPLTADMQNTFELFSARAKSAFCELPLSYKRTVGSFAQESNWGLGHIFGDVTK
jgi:hypothetical protein